MKSHFIVWFFVLAFAASRAENAPVTTAGRVIGATPGDPSVPIDITVSDFINIGKFTLTLKFDTLKVKYVSASANPELPGMTVSFLPPSGNNFGKVVMAWTGASNVSLTDNSVIAGLVFSYVSGTGLLSWDYTYGSVCRYHRYVNGDLTTLADNPKFDFFQDGGIADRGAPLTAAPVIEDPVEGTLLVPVTVDDFDDIGGFTLYLEYDPDFIIYSNTYVKNPAFQSNFIVGDNPGYDGKRFIIIQWYGSPVSLTDGATMCTLNFSYPMALCDPAFLTWYDIGPTCEFSDGAGSVLLDMPFDSYFSDGKVEAGLPVTWTGNLNSSWDDPGNWSACGMPDSTRNVVIPDVSPNVFPVISGTRYCKSIIVQPGAMLTISNTGSVIVGD
jgi:hypothetical protein